MLTLLYHWTLESMMIRSLLQIAIHTAMLLVSMPHPACAQPSDWCDMPSVPPRNGIIAFNDSNRGWLLSYRSVYPMHFGAIYRTDDGAQTWVLDQEVHLSSYGADGRLFCIAMADTLTGWIGGKTARTNHPDMPLLLKRGWLPGTVGVMWHRQDIQIPPENAIQSIWVFDANHLIVGTSRGLIAQSIDGGTTWIVLDSIVPATPIDNIHFTDENHGWLESRDALYRTIDGGKSWSLLDYGTPFSIQAIHFIGESGWIAGDAGRIRHTTNGGINWTDQWSTTGSKINDLHFFSEQHGLAVGGGVYDIKAEKTVDSARILQTWDGGSNWHQVQHPRDTVLTQLSMVDGKTGFVIGKDVLYRYCGDNITGVRGELATVPECEPLAYDFLGRAVDRIHRGPTLLYYPCTHTAKFVLR
jgi:photosystem II stability/assembly factor-like uncharacterized protein